MLGALSSNRTASGAVAFAALSTYFVFKKAMTLYKEGQVEKERVKRLIIITGCDTGLGYSMAVWTAKLGYKVIAACLNENGEGAQKLKKQFSEQIIIAGLNVTDTQNIENFHTFCREFLETNAGKLRLWAVITNAAVSTMGEYFWQTRRQCEQQMSVNFWGTVNLISELRTLLFETKARLIVISSDCSEYPLPYLSVYGASKAALNAWAQSFRFEVAKYGIHVVAYQPTGFAQNSGLFTNIELHYNQMVSEMSNYERNVYGEYFDNFMKKKQEIFESTKKNSVRPLNSGTHRQSIKYLLESDIRGISIYRDFSWMEKIFHAMYNTLPQYLVDRLVMKVLNPDDICWKEHDLTVKSTM